MFLFLRAHSSNGSITDLFIHRVAAGSNHDSFPLSRDRRRPSSFHSSFLRLFLPSFLFMALNIVITVISLLLINGTRGFQGGRQPLLPSHIVAHSFSSGVVYISLFSTHSLIIMIVGSLSTRVSTRLLSGRTPSGEGSPSEVNKILQ